MLKFLPITKGYTLENKGLTSQQNCQVFIPKMNVKVKSATQSVLIILAMNGLFQKKF